MMSAPRRRRAMHSACVRQKENSARDEAMQKMVKNARCRQPKMFISYAKDAPATQRRYAHEEACRSDGGEVRQTPPISRHEFAHEALTISASRTPKTGKMRTILRSPRASEQRFCHEYAIARSPQPKQPSMRMRFARKEALRPDYAADALPPTPEDAAHLYAGALCSAMTPKTAAWRDERWMIFTLRRLPPSYTPAQRDIRRCAGTTACHDTRLRRDAQR